MSDSDQGCDGCSRRAVLQGFVAASALVPLACRMDDPTFEGGTPDAPGGNDGGVDPGFAMCGANLCVDLNSPANMALATVGGSRVIAFSTTKIMVVRTSDTEFGTVSAVCTHAGCTVRFTQATNTLNCPCHGSQFGVDGTLQRGPALTDLRVFQNTFDQAGGLLTIRLQ